MRMGSQTQRLAYDLQHLFLKTMILEAGVGPSERVFSGWTLGCRVTKIPCKPLVFNHRELTLSCFKHVTAPNSVPHPRNTLTNPFLSSCLLFFTENGKALLAYHPALDHLVPSGLSTSSPTKA